MGFSIKELLGVPDEPLSNAVFSYFALKEIDEFFPDKKKKLETENLELQNKRMRREYGISEEDASLDTAMLGGAAYGLEKAKQGLSAPKGAKYFSGVESISDLLLRNPGNVGLRTNIATNPFKSAARTGFANRIVSAIRTASL